MANVGRREFADNASSIHAGGSDLIFRAAAFAAFVSVAPAADAAGQTVNDLTGAIVGRVTDQTMAALPDVRVEISGPGLIAPLTTSTNGEGAYWFLALPPAEYVLVFSRQGFVTQSYSSVRVALRATTTVDTVMVAGLATDVIVLGAPPLLDRKSPSVTVSFDAAQLGNLPGTRSMGAVLSATPAVHLARFDVGGSAGLISPLFSAYGTDGEANPMLEGIFIGRINPYGLTLDYGSFQEVSVTSAAFGIDNQMTGLRIQFVTKSGGNRYHGSFYADYGDRRWQAINIDDRQIGRVAAAGESLSRDANRLWSYRDVNADVGGFIKKDRLWWYASARGQATSARLVSFPVKPYRTEVANFTVKGTLRVNDRHKIVAFANLAYDHEPSKLEGFNPAGSRRTQLSSINLSEDSTSKRLSFASITKAEWNWTAGTSWFGEVRVGRFAPRQEESPNGGGARFENITTTEVSGGNRDWEATTSIPQVVVSTTYSRHGRLGSHLVKLSAEIQQWNESISWRRAYPGDVLHVFATNDLGVAQPWEVYLFRTPSRSESGAWWYTTSASDVWQVNRKLSINLGLRFHRTRVFLPEQFHPDGPVTAATQIFPANDNLVDWNIIEPRVALVYQLANDGKTLAKASYGFYSGGGSPPLGFSANPNSDQPWDRYEWIDDNRDGLWQAGEEKRALATRGVDQIDPGLKAPYTREVTFSLERELPGGLAVRSGFVWRGARQRHARQDDNRPWSAYSLETTFRDPGPNGVTGDGDDGPDITAYPPPSVPSHNVVRNIPGADDDHWTWDITVLRRSRGRWSLATGFAHTWSREQANEYAGEMIRQNIYALTPNDLTNTVDGRHEFTVWCAKIHGTYHLPWDVRLSPLLRHQSGQPFGRTLANAVRGVGRILAEPIGTRRMDHLTTVDVRVEKGFQLPATARAAAFIDVFNLLNANPEQNINWVSGSGFLRPISIVAPRIARIGVKVDW